MTVKEIRAKARVASGSILMDTDNLKTEVSELLNKAMDVANAPTDRAAKVRITKIEKAMASFEVELNELKNRVEANGGIFPEFDGVVSDFATVVSTVNREKEFTFGETEVAEEVKEETEEVETDTETKTETTKAKTKKEIRAERKEAYETARANFLNSDADDATRMNLKAIKDAAFQAYKPYRI